MVLLMKKILSILIVILAMGTHVYAGCISGDCDNGYGVYKYENPSGTYSGYYKKEKRHGEGKYEFPNGDVFEGSWYKDKPKGYGIMTWADESVYSGDWKKFNRHGYGKMVWATDAGKANAGEIWKGKWKNDNFYGEIRKTNVINNVNNANVADMIQNAKNTCKSLGFNEGTEKFTDCSLKLYSQSLDLATKQNQQVVIQNQGSSSDTVRVIDVTRERENTLRKAGGLIDGSCTLATYYKC